MDLAPGTYVLVKYGQPRRCQECQWCSAVFALSNEVVLDEQGALVGIRAVVRYHGCGHEVPNAVADEVAVAEMLNACEDGDGGA